MSLDTLYETMIKQYKQGQIRYRQDFEMSNGYYFTWGHGLISNYPILIKLDIFGAFCITINRPEYEFVDENYDLVIYRYE